MGETPRMTKAMEHRQRDPASVGKSQGAQGTQERLLIQSKGSGTTFQV